MACDLYFPAYDDLPSVRLLTSLVGSLVAEGRVCGVWEYSQSLMTLKCLIPALRWHGEEYNIISLFSFPLNTVLVVFNYRSSPSTILHLIMRVSSLFAFSVLALVAPIAAAPQPLELYEIEGTSTHIVQVITTGLPQTTAVPDVDPSGNIVIYMIDGTSTRTFPLGTGRSHTAHHTGSYKPVGTGSWHRSHGTGQHSFAAGTGRVSTRTTSLPSYATPSLGSPKLTRAVRDTCK